MCENMLDRQRTCQSNLPSIRQDFYKTKTVAITCIFFFHSFRRYYDTCTKIPHNHNCSFFIKIEQCKSYRLLEIMFNLMKTFAMRYPKKFHRARKFTFRHQENTLLFQRFSWNKTKIFLIKSHIITNLYSKRTVSMKPDQEGKHNYF